MKMRRPIGSFVILFFLIASAVNCQNYRLSTAVAPTVYDIHITIDLDNFKFQGEETIHVHVNDDTSVIELHVLDLTVDEESVKVNEGANAFSIESVQYDTNTQIYRITLEQSLIAGRDYELDISFEADIKDDLKGLYRSSYYESISIKYMATTFSAAAYARKIFPCFDEPALKAKFNLVLTNKEIYVPLANTKVKSVERFRSFGEFWTNTIFETTPIMSTYLLAFAVSEFKNLTETNPMEFSVYSSQKAISNMTYALETGVKALKTLEDYVGHSYTLGKMDFIAIDDFLMGAMENWGFISFKSSRILNDGKKSLRKLQEITNIISHELVHMFFGNQVTCEYWDYVWLNEGFASYLEYVIADKILPHLHVLDYFLVNRFHTVMIQDVAPKTHRMTRPINTPEEISKIYDFVAYPKAASVIRMIEHIMRPEVFRKALHVYIEERSYKSATDEQLFEVLERVAREEMPGAPSIKEIFRNWAGNEGYPILNLFLDGNNANVSQELFVPFINKTAPSEFFITFNYASSSSNDFDETSHTYLLQKKDDIIRSITAAEDRWIIANKQQTGYFRVNYDDSNWDAIISELTTGDHNLIHNLNRAQLLDDSFNLARYDYLNFNKALSLLQYLRRETSLVPLIAGMRSIDFLLTFLDQQNYYKNLHDNLMEIVDEIYVRINNASNEIKAEDIDYHTLAKLHVNLFACRVGSKPCLKDARSKLFLFDYEQYELDANQRPYLYCGILGDDMASLNWVMMKMKIIEANGNEELYRDKQEEFTEIFHAFSACDRDLVRVTRLLDDIFKYSNETLNYQYVSKENAIQVVENLIQTSSAHRNLIMKYYADNLEVVSEKVPFKEILSIFGGVINTVAELDKFKSLATTAGLSSDEIKETIDQIAENILWITAKSPEIETWVKSITGSASRITISFLVAILFVTLTILK